MRLRALIVGSQTFGLSGVHADVSAMSEALQARGFATDIRMESNASREGILEGYRRLITDSGQNDAALVYYSGHGGRAENPRYQPGSPIPKTLQYIVPTDCAADNFKGILDFELSLLLGQLTNKTHNVTVILDCCHSARMSRDQMIVPKAVHCVWYEGIEEHLQSQRLEIAGLHPESNPNAVRMVATEADKSAYESPKPDGSYAGEMTTALLLALKEAGEDDVSWHALGMRVREIVLSHIPEQRPEVEGPSQRLLFSTQEANREGAVVFFRKEGQPFLRAGRLIGSEVGAEYGIPSPQKELALATVIAVEGSVSRVKLEMYRPDSELMDGALAFPLKLPFLKRNVRILGSSPANDDLRAAIVSSPFLEVAADGQAVIASVRTDDGLEVFDPQGAALTKRLASDTEGIKEIVPRLTNLARADALRCLENGGLVADIRLTWGYVVDQQTEPKEVPMSEGDTFHVGDRLFVRIENAGTSPVFIAIYDIGIDGSIVLLTKAEPSGVKLDAGGAYRLGERAGLLTGLEPAYWPQDVPADGLRSEALVVIAAEDRQEFRALETPVAKRDKPLTELEQLLDHFRSGRPRSGRPRNVPPETQVQGGRYLVRHIGFSLSPRPRPVSGKRATFLIDERPATSYISRGAALPAEHVPRRIAIRLKDLVVHRNRALWYANIRIDTLVVTGTKAEAGAPYIPGTYHFSRIGDEERLPFDDLLIFEGEPQLYIDFAIWVSRDKAGSKPLGELLRDVANDNDFQNATTALVGLAVAAPQAAAMVGAVAAASTIGYFTAKVIDTAVGNSIGIYRTSFLPVERFGLGHHPTRGMLRAQDYSLRYEVIEPS